MEHLNGPQCIPKITSVKNEKFASYYAQTRKTYQIIRAADIQLIHEHPSENFISFLSSFRSYTFRRNSVIL